MEVTNTSAQINLASASPRPYMQVYVCMYICVPVGYICTHKISKPIPVTGREVL
jgi:hypothetical protein